MNIPVLYLFLLIGHITLASEIVEDFNPLSRNYAIHSDDDLQINFPQHQGSLWANFTMTLPQSTKGSAPFCQVTTHNLDWNLVANTRVVSLDQGIHILDFIVVNEEDIVIIASDLIVYLYQVVNSNIVLRRRSFLLTVDKLPKDNVCKFIRNNEGFKDFIFFCNHNLYQLFVTRVHNEPPVLDLMPLKTDRKQNIRLNDPRNLWAYGRFIVIADGSAGISIIDILEKENLKHKQVMHSQDFPGVKAGEPFEVTDVVVANNNIFILEKHRGIFIAQSDDFVTFRMKPESIPFQGGKILSWVNSSLIVSGENNERTYFAEIFYEPDGTWKINRLMTSKRAINDIIIQHDYSLILTSRGTTMFIPSVAYETLPNLLSSNLLITNELMRIRPYGNFAIASTKSNVYLIVPKKVPPYIYCTPGMISNVGTYRVAVTFNYFCEREEGVQRSICTLTEEFELGILARYFKTERQAILLGLLGGLIVAFILCLVLCCFFVKYRAKLREVDEMRIRIKNYEDLASPTEFGLNNISAFPVEGAPSTSKSSDVTNPYNKVDKTDMSGRVGDPES